MNDELARQLAKALHKDREKYADPGPIPVIHWGGHAVKSLRRAWAYAKKEAKIHRELRLYDLRHAFASNALRYGADLKSVSKLVGHSREDTTLRVYQHVVDEQMRDAVLQLGMRFFWTYRALMK